MTGAVVLSAGLLTGGAAAARIATPAVAVPVRAAEAGARALTTTSAVHGLRGVYAIAPGAPADFTRIDRQPDFDWRRARPRTGFAASGFTVRWNGTMTVPRTGLWRLILTVRGDGAVVLRTGSPRGGVSAHTGATGGRRSGPRSAVTASADLVAGRRYALDLTYRAPAHSGGSVALDWARGPGPVGEIPAGALVPATLTPSAPSSPGSPTTTTAASPPPAGSSTATGGTTTAAGMSSGSTNPATGATAATSTATQTTPAAPTIPPATPTPPTPPSPPSSPPVVHPAFGGNVNGNADYSPDFMFTDAMLSAGSFYALNSDGNGLDLNTPASVDANGWPTGDFGFYVNEQAPQPGTYTVEGTAAQAPDVALSLTGGNVGTLTYDPGTGDFSVPVTVDEQNDMPDGGGPGEFILLFRNTNGGVRDLHVIRPGYAASDPPVFTHPFLAELKANDPTALRAMDLAAENANVTSTWSQRTLPDQPQGLQQTATVPWDDGPDQSITSPKGIAWEYIVDLANAAQTSIWINVPVLADDDYVTQLAQLIKNQLDPGLDVYVEYSNELWNYGFDQAHINAGLAENAYNAGDTTLAYDGTSDIYTLANRRDAERTVQISQLFKSVWGSEDDRVHTVLANQYANPSNVAQQLDYIAAEIGPPSDDISDIAAAPYVSVPDGAGLSDSDVLSDLSSAIDQQQASGTTLDWRSEAGAYGVGLVAYEGGFDTYGANSVDAKAAAMHDPAITALVERYLTNWYADGGGLLNWYTLGTGSFDSDYGDWSITDDQSDLSEPKELGVQDIAGGPAIAPTAGTLLPAQIDARQHSFQHGIPVDPMVRYLSAGDNLDYLIRAPAAGTYPLSVLATGGPAPIDVSVDGTSVGTITTAAPTAGQDVAPSSSLALSLSAGLHVIRLTVPENNPFDLDSLLISQDGGPALGPLLPRMNNFDFYQDQTLAQGASFSNSFTVADSATAADQLKVTATSDNQSVVADSDITLTREPGGEVDFTITADPGASGSADVIFTVTDAAGLQRQTEMAITVG
jgi:hypothetical protein